MFPRRSCSIRFHDSVTNELHLNAPYYEIAVIRKFQNPTRPSGSGETKGKESSFNRFLKKKKKKKNTHVKTILVENWILFMFYEIFDFREISRPLMNSIENSNLGIVGKYREIRGEFRQVSAKSLREWGKFWGEREDLVTSGIAEEKF